MKKATGKAGKQRSPKQGHVDRRTFVKLVPALGVAAATFPHLASTTLAQTPTPTPSPLPTPTPTPTPAPLRVTKEMMHGAEQLFGIELTDAHKQLALQSVNTNLERYETLRKIDVPLDTEPAIRFHPALPGKKFNIKASKFKMSKVEAPKFASIEDLSFSTVPQLAELIRTRKVSPVELTKMYLARLKRYGPKLNCVVTLTEDLALAQAADAESEIKRGTYRGPLHVFPWGAMFFFATNGFGTTWGAVRFRYN
jgi:hypothetical protein